jgi:hypothetical protein
MKKSLVIVGVLLSVVCSAQQIPKGLTASNGEFIGFYEYKPVDYNTGTKYPVIIFLHGIGERGNGTTELSRVLGNGTPQLIRDGHNMRFFWNGKWETFLVLTPQLASKYGNWENFYVDEMIKYAENNLSIDRNRIFLTGLSLGGGGVWKFAAGSETNARRLAGIGVTCGTCEPRDYGNIARANLPTWAWHANDDGTVGAGCSNSAISGILAANPAVKPYLTLWPTGNHWIWSRVYDVNYWAQHPNIYEWFLGQNKSLAPNKRPVANAGPDQNISSLSVGFTLDGGGSRDEDGNIVQYIWTKVSGPSSGSITAEVSAGSSTTVIGLSLPGTYVYELRVIDNRSDWTTDQVTINVSSILNPSPIGNQNPVARAGSDATITLPTNSATLNGDWSSDADGSLTSFTWSKVAGPSQFTLNNSTSSRASVTNLVQGTYTFRLTVKDNNNGTHSDDVNITVNGSSTTPTPEPTKWANAGQDISITLPTNSTTLDGSASADVSTGKPLLEYQWKKISGPSQYSITSPKAATTALTNLAEGTYAFELMTWRYNWEPRADTVVVTVKAGTGSGGTPTGDPNRWANAGQDITITLPTNNTTLNGSASADISTGKPLLEYQWKKISGPSQYSITSPKAAITALTNLAEGTYAFELMTWRYNWEPRADTVVVTVKAGTGSGGTPTGDPNRWANAGQDITITLPTNNTTLNGSASADISTGKPLLEYKWRHISGPSQYTITNPKAVITTLTNLTQGVYSFELMTWRYNWEPRADTVYVLVMSGTAASGVAISGSSEPIMSTARNAGRAETTVDKLTVYPNPAHGMINVQMVAGESGKTVINVYDVTGRNVQTVNFEKAQSLQQRSLNVTRLAPGVYHLEVIINNRKKMITKFIKQ